MARRAELIPAQRQAMVLEHIRLHGIASIQELAKGIGVSGSTIRRDLEELAAAGYLERTRGGALLESARRSTFEPDAAMAAEFARVQKRAIAAAAEAMVADGESVIFDSSSTVRELARLIARRDIALTAVTNDLGICSDLASRSSITLVVPGGTLRPGSLTLHGDPGRTFLETVHVDTTFLGTHAISNGYLSETSIEVASLKRRAVDAARRVVLLADSTKFQAPAFARICELTQIDVVVTDQGIPADEAQGLRDLGITLIIAPTLPDEADRP